MKEKKFKFVSFDVEKGGYEFLTYDNEENLYDTPQEAYDAALNVYGPTADRNDRYRFAVVWEWVKPKPNPNEKAWKIEWKEGYEEKWSASLSYKDRYTEREADAIVAGANEAQGNICELLWRKVVA